MIKPHANYVLILDESDKFCSILESVKFPNGYCSDIAKYIKDGALKSHDYHALMQTLILLVLKGLMEPTTRLAIMQSCHLFERLCCKI